jgi:phosphatidylinositol-4,5-bisphosphate 3-kinase
MPTTVSVDCLLPTGILVTVDCLRDAPLERIKADLWKQAKRYPGYSRLGNMTSYVFESVLQDAEREEFFDESRRLCDLKLFLLLLRVVEPEGNILEKKINFDIGQ